MTKRPRRTKRPRARKLQAVIPSINPSDARRPNAAEGQLDYMKMLPAWRISRLEIDGPFGWEPIDATTAISIQIRLKGFESMTWYEILDRRQIPVEHSSPEDIVVHQLVVQGEHSQGQDRRQRDHPHD